MYGTINPCWYNPFSAVVLFIVVVITVYPQFRRALAAADRSGKSRGAVHVIQTAVACTALLLHAAAWTHFVAGASSAWSDIASESGLVAIWAIVLVALVRCQQSAMVPRLKAFALTAVIAYSFGAYSEVQLFLHHVAPTRAEQIARLVLTCVLEAAVIAFVIAEHQK